MSDAPKSKLTITPSTPITLQPKPNLAPVPVSIAIDQPTYPDPVTLTPPAAKPKGIERPALPDLMSEEYQSRVRMPPDYSPPQPPKEIPHASRA